MIKSGITGGNILMSDVIISIVTSGGGGGSWVSGSTTSISGHLVGYTGTSGQVIADTGIAFASILTSGVVLSGVGGSWVSGSTTSTSGDLVIYTGTSGQVIADIGIASWSLVSSPGAAASGNVTIFSGTSGKVIVDSGVPLASILTSGVVISGGGGGGSWVSGPATSISGNITIWTGTSGKVVADSGILATGMLSGSGSSTSGHLAAYIGTGGIVVADSGIAYASILTSGSGGTAFSGWVTLAAGTDFSTTPASTSGITMLTNQSGNISQGSPIMFTLSGSNVYYAQETVITSGLMTIRGPPLSTTSGVLTALSYGDRIRMGQLTLSMPGYWDATSGTNYTYLNNNNLMQNGYRWDLPTCYLVGYDFIATTPDGAGTAYVNVLWGTWTSGAVGMSGLSTLNSGKGLAVSSGATVYKTGVDIPATQAISYGQSLEVQVTPGTSGNATNGTPTILFVVP